MDDLRKFLRYEIPGIITIIYFLMFSSPVLFVILDQLKTYNMSLIDILSELAIMIVILALPAGFLVYNSYLLGDYEKFLENRKGYEIVEHILEIDPSLENELGWWKEADTETKSEVLDVIFCGKEKDLGKALERFVNFYHSSIMIGKYAPCIAFWAAMILIGVLLLSSHITLQIIISNLRSFIPFYIFAFLLKIVIYLKMIPPTRKGERLLKRINELETNIVLLEKENIKKLVKEKTSSIRKNSRKKKNNEALIELYKSHLSMTRTYWNLFYTLITFSIIVGLGGIYKL